jgi:hypothetical protein
MFQISAREAQLRTESIYSKYHSSNLRVIEIDCMRGTAKRAVVSTQFSKRCPDQEHENEAYSSPCKPLPSRAAFNGSNGPISYPRHDLWLILEASIGGFTVAKIFVVRHTSSSLRFPGVLHRGGVGYFPFDIGVRLGVILQHGTSHRAER